MNTACFTTIGIGVAFSPNLKANLYEAARLAIAFKARLLVIHVGNQTTEKDKILKEILTHFSQEQLDYKIIYELGDPVAVILHSIITKKIDLLVLGALKREKLVTFYLGSIARKITRKASCAVLLLIKPSVNRVPCKHIVVNGLHSPKTEKTIHTSFYVGHYLGAKKLTVAEEISQQKVQVKVNDDKSLRKATIVKERLRLREDSRVKKIVEDVPASFKHKIKVTTQSIFGRSGYSIGHYAQFVRADLLVMNASDTASFWDRFFTHDLEYILIELPTDVLIVR